MRPSEDRIAEVCKILSRHYEDRSAIGLDAKTEDVTRSAVR